MKKISKKPMGVLFCMLIFISSLSAATEKSESDLEIVVKGGLFGINCYLKNNGDVELPGVAIRPEIESSPFVLVGNQIHSRIPNIPAGEEKWILHISIIGFGFAEIVLKPSNDAVNTKNVKVLVIALYNLILLIE